MGEIVIRCTCGQSMRAPREAVGKLGRCVNCGRPVRVQEAKPVVSAVTSFESDSGIEQEIRAIQDVPAKFNPEPEKRRDTSYAGLAESMQRLQDLWGDEQTTPAPQAVTPARPRHNVPVPAPVAEPRCARCGRAFRGDWDRHPREEGVLCNICARQLPPERTPWDAPIDRGTVPPPSHEELREIARLTNRREKPERDPNKYRGLPVFLAFGVATMLLVWLLPVEKWVGSFMLEVFSAEMPPRGTNAYYAVLAAGLSGVFLAQFVALYLTLAQANKLPVDVFVANAFHVAVVTLVVWFFSFVASVLSAFIPGPYVIFLYGLVLCIQVYIVWTAYDLVFSDIVVYSVMRYVCGVLFGLLNPLTIQLVAWMIGPG